MNDYYIGSVCIASIRFSVSDVLLYIKLITDTYTRIYESDTNKYNTQYTVAKSDSLAAPCHPLWPIVICNLQQNTTICY